MSNIQWSIDPTIKVLYDIKNNHLALTNFNGCFKDGIVVVFYGSTTYKCYIDGFEIISDFIYLGDL